ncbi:MAG: 2-hydroxyacyl-CoA dehydratase [Negativicutes bacterium]|jgi:benzoyl-CoA reductase/2-hydroxyglutaryl-CoA dehydratase subunit BcrC/BadD/HgdB|nr:2-hydroxyacyl-CoA dehydratase [Negativicutes bacterium]MBP8628800.1 2-hydroxyacyl-CoA dehydratase [Negativicutes bacterium]MBP9537081.1 2-hydroxyacyl-CoA dehydratase [Negativicutes bacterium]MBP9948782.1 2-hydroxyacyl-CoA dehydratase [Negativicutes bacterium]
MLKIGITTTVPVEIILAAGYTPVDLNNIFIMDNEPNKLVEAAETAGYPRNICGWIKGLYSVVLSPENNINKIIAVTQGDCSNTHALMETLQLAGVETIPFAYPFDRDYDLLRLQMDKLIKILGTDWDSVEQQRKRLVKLRKKVAEIDALTWQKNNVSGIDNHIFQVSCSDFDGNVDLFEKKVDQFLLKAQTAPEKGEELRLAFIGVPPICPDIYNYLESIGARVVFNEVQRQFAMPNEVADIVTQYQLYTYPYGVFGRLEDIQEEIDKRNIDGVIHYVQSFCYRQIEDMIFREKLNVPLLTIEGDKPGKIDARTKLRIDSFVEMLK